MTKKELFELLKDLPDDGEINFFLLPDDEDLRNEGDENDEPIGSLEIIYGGGIDGDMPFVDLGLIRII